MCMCVSETFSPGEQGNGCCQGRGLGGKVEEGVSYVLAVWGTRAFAMRDTQILDKKKTYP